MIDRALADDADVTAAVYERTANGKAVVQPRTNKNLPGRDRGGASRGAGVGRAPEPPPGDSEHIRF